ncbi:MAG: cellulose biosynthesis protein BcsQ [Pigmentiphaga sp.]|nr:cellulose biosynthesis protein BcsQ [Pigmentiphaga sp.]
MNVVAIVSAKGGVGKTTVCANLAVALARRQRQVLAVDLDPQNALRHHFGLDPSGLAGLSRATLGESDLLSVCQPTDSGVIVLPYGMVNETDRETFETVLAQEPAWLARHLGDLALNDDAIVVLDTPPGPSIYLRQALTAAHLVLVVTLADAASYATLPMIEGLIETYCAGRSGFIDHAFIINQVNRSRQLARDVVLSMQASLGDRVVSLLHQDQAVSEALACNQSVLDYDPYCQGTSDFQHTADWVLESLRQSPPHP